MYWLIDSHECLFTYWCWIDQIIEFFSLLFGWSKEAEEYVLWTNSSLSQIFLRILQKSFWTNNEKLSVDFSNEAFYGFSCKLNPIFLVKFPRCTRCSKKMSISELFAILANGHFFWDTWYILLQKKFSLELYCNTFISLE